VVRQISHGINLPANVCDALFVQNMQLSQIDSIVVAGGKATRIGGIDKAMLPLGLNQKTLLASVVASCPGKVIVAGSNRPEINGVTWVDDLSADGGPAAGIWAALTQINSEYVFISAGDQRINSDQVNQICLAALGHDGAWAVRENGQGQPLLACVKSQLIKDLLQESKGVNASPLRLMQQLNMVEVKVATSEVLDIDTWADAINAVKESGMSEVTPVWLKQVAATLGIPETEIPVNALLDLTRDVAHNVERKSAPLTTFLIGLAAGKTGASEKELIEKVEQAIKDWTPSE
jgi:molybdopterin-guanine dinucleotide biosynthesis protein A